MSVLVGVAAVLPHALRMSSSPPAGAGSGGFAVRIDWPGCGATEAAATNTPEASTVSASEFATSDATLRARALDLLREHIRDDDGRCRSPACRQAPYPCVPRRVAEVLSEASTGPWHRQWTARIDAHRCSITFP